MKRILRWVLSVAVGVLGVANAAYDINANGQVGAIITYPNLAYVYVQLKNQPTSHPACNPAYFVIEETIPSDRRKFMLARLALAYALQENVNIGYDSQGNCSSGGYIPVLRLG